MDPVKTGRFIAALRRQKGLTQEALGQKLGVTNKTISRWENGNYMPDLEMLPILAEQFGVSIHELLAGQRIAENPLSEKADANISAPPKASAFSLAERREYFKKKWRGEHIPLFLLLGAILALSIGLPLWFGIPWLTGLAPAVALAEYGYQHNRMMAYVEHCLYD